MPILIELLQAETISSVYTAKSKPLRNAGCLYFGHGTLDTLFRRKRETTRKEEQDLSKEGRSEETDQIVAQIGNELDGKHSLTIRSMGQSGSS